MKIPGRIIREEKGARREGLSRAGSEEEGEGGKRAAGQPEPGGFDWGRDKRQADRVERESGREKLLYLVPGPREADY
jgi:hypothetical protein